MFEGHLEEFDRQLKLEGDIEWTTEEGRKVLIKRIQFAYAWDPETGGPTSLKVGVGSNLSQIDDLAHNLVPPPPSGSAWDELMEAIGRGMDDVGYDAPAALLFNAPPEVLEELASRLKSEGYEDLEEAVENDDIASLLFGFQHYEMEGLEVGPAEG
jgi:hypothetical protein